MTALDTSRNVLPYQLKGIALAKASIGLASKLVQVADRSKIARLRSMIDTSFHFRLGKDGVKSWVVRLPSGIMDLCQSV